MILWQIAIAVPAQAGCITAHCEIKLQKCIASRNIMRDV
ncbi:hypothetical protein Z949_3165 [Sulfitobacter guttiformis KCTC 32187]|nr:hypothetical protein Z949_3165 [Sulfitobacter guttiformis KCTC 32187]